MAAEVEVSAEQQQARELSWSGEYAPSLQIYGRLRQAHPDDMALLREVGLVQLWAGRELDAIQSLERVLAGNPSDAEARLSLGRAHWYLGDAERAAAPFALALPKYQEDPTVVAEAVQVFEAAGKDQLAKGWLDYGLARFSESPDLALIEVRRSLAAGELDAAETRLEALVASHPDHSAAGELLRDVKSQKASPLALARKLADQGNYGKARRLLQGHLNKTPGDGEARHQLALFDSWSGEYAAAQAGFRKLLEAQPDQRLYRTELAEVTTWRGQYGPAREMFEGLIDEDRSDLRSRLGLGNVHAWSGVHAFADPVYRGILEDDPNHEGARKQLRNLNQIRSPSAEPGFSYFKDNGGFSLWTATSELLYSTRPGRTWSLNVDLPKAEGEINELVNPITGETRRRTESVQGYGFRVGFRERPDEKWEFQAELGAASYSQGGFTPRLRGVVSRWVGYRHLFQLDLQHGDALPDSRSIESAIAGVERSTAFLVHMYNGERLTTWSRLEGGRYSDDASFWTARTVVGWALLKKPFELEILGLATAGDFDRNSPLYYSPQDLLTYAAGIRAKKRLWGRADLVVIAEYGRIHSDGGVGTSLHYAPEINWEMTETTKLYLRYDHYESLRDGLVYKSDLVQVGVRYRVPVLE